MNRVFIKKIALFLISAQSSRIIWPFTLEEDIAACSVNSSVNFKDNFTLGYIEHE